MISNLSGSVFFVSSLLLSLRIRSSEPRKTPFKMMSSSNSNSDLSRRNSSSASSSSSSRSISHHIQDRNNVNGGIGNSDCIGREKEARVHSPLLYKFITTEKKTEKARKIPFFPFISNFCCCCLPNPLTPSCPKAFFAEIAQMLTRIETADKETQLIKGSFRSRLAPQHTYRIIIIVKGDNKKTMTKQITARRDDTPLHTAVREGKTEPSFGDDRRTTEGK